MKKTYKKIAIFSITILLTSIIISLIINNVYKINKPFAVFIDTIFFIDFPIFIIGSWLLMSEKGLFNVINYSTHQFLSVVSKKYTYEIKQYTDLDTKESVKNYLKEKYLYRQPKYSLTFPLFYSSSLILISLFIYIILNY